MKKNLRGKEDSAGGQPLQRLTTFADAKFHYLLNNLATLVSGQRTRGGVRGAVRRSKWGRKAAKQRV